MQYDEKIARKMLKDERWSGIIKPEMAKVWKSRGVIPDQYFNPHYLNLIAEGKQSLADKVKDKYYNEEYILRLPQTEDEKRREEIVLRILKSPKFFSKRVLEQEKIKPAFFQDAIRVDRKSRMLSEHTLRLKKAIVKMRNDLQNLINVLENVQSYELRHAEQIDTFLKDARISKAPFLGGHATFANRHSTRNRGKSQYFDNDEIEHFLHHAKIFLLETQTEL